MYSVRFTDESVSDGYRSEAEAVREAMVLGDGCAEIVWLPEQASLGHAHTLWVELGLGEEQ